jgi:predicted molibdopterin-dependent oxidoreductase YjgC
MDMKRIDRSSPLLPSLQRGASVRITVDGKSIQAYRGETVAAALLTAGVWTFQLSRKHKSPRGLYCGMGVCHECLVTIDEVPAQRACLTPVEDGMQIETCKELEL